MNDIKLEKDQLYTLKELALISDVSVCRIRLIFNRLQIKPQQLNVPIGHSHYIVNFYSAEDSEKMLKVIQETENQKEIKKQKKIVKEVAEPKDLENLKKLHPLVRDERCFNLNWWPDVDLAL